MPPLECAHVLFAVEATVRLKSGSVIITTALRHAEPEAPAVGDLTSSAAAMVDLRHTVSIPRTDLPSLPVGSTVEADFGDGLRTYRIDRVDDRVPDEWRVMAS